MVEVARTHKLQIMHVHYAIPFAAAAINARQIAPELDLKVVTTLHGTDITLVGSSPSFKPVTQWSIEQSDAVTAVSRYLRDETYRQIPVQARRSRSSTTSSIPTATTCACPPASREKTSERQVTLMHISNFRPLKRTDDVVRIFARVRESLDARLVLVGDGPEYGRTRELVEKLGLDDVRALRRASWTTWCPCWRPRTFFSCPRRRRASGWWHWKPWPAACPWWPATSGACPRSSSTA